MRERTVGSLRPGRTSRPDPGPASCNNNSHSGWTYNVTQISVGWNHACAVLSDGGAKCWGLNGNGQLGQGHTANIGDEPNEMGDNLTNIDLGTGVQVSKVMAAATHTCAIATNGSLKCWGANNYGQLGLGDNSGRGSCVNQMGDSLPFVDLGTGRTALEVVGGQSHTCAMLDDYSMKCWGSSYWGECGGTQQTNGNGVGEMGDSLASVDLGTGRTARGIAVGLVHTCAVLDNADVKCWGYNGYGQLGIGSTAIIGRSSSDMGDNLVAASMGSGLNASQVDANGYRTCVVLTGGEMKCFGQNTNGGAGQDSTNNLGDAANEMGANLTPINLGVSRTATSGSCGVIHTCAVLNTGELKCWGNGLHGSSSRIYQ
eukprot:199553_1